MHNTSIIRKTLPSLINGVAVLMFASPVFFLTDSGAMRRGVIVAVCFLYNVAFLLFNRSRDLGMMLCRTYWAEQYTYRQQFVFLILYTASFSTAVVWVWLPFDLMLMNLLLLQLPTVLLTGTTLHGWLSGKMATVTR